MRGMYTEKIELCINQGPRKSRFPKPDGHLDIWTDKNNYSIALLIKREVTNQYFGLDIASKKIFSYFYDNTYNDKFLIAKLLDNSDGQTNIRKIE